MEVPRLGVESQLQWTTYTTATAMPVTYTTAQGKTRSLTHWATPRIKPKSSWICRVCYPWTTMGTRYNQIFYPNCALKEALHHPLQPQVRSQTFKLVCLFVCPQSRHVEVPRPGIQPVPQWWPEPQQWQHQVLNPLSHQKIPKLLLKEGERLFTQFQVLHIACLQQKYYTSHLTMRKQSAEGKVTCPKLHTRKWWNPDSKPSLHAINVHILFSFIYSTNIYEHWLHTRSWRDRNESQGHT